MATYPIRVSGYGRIAIGDGTNYDFSESDHDFEPVPNSGTGQLQGTYSGGAWNDADTTDQFTTLHRTVHIKKTGLTIGEVTKVTVTYDYTQGSPASVVETARWIDINGNGNTVASNSYDQLEDGTDIVWTWTGSVTDVTEIAVRIDSDYDGTDPKSVAGSVSIKSIVINGGSDVLADGFYYWSADDVTIPPTLSPNGSFLYIDGAAIPHSEPYSPHHVYELTVELTPGTQNLSFTDSYNSDYADNEAGKSLKVEFYEAL